MKARQPANTAVETAITDWLAEKTSEAAPAQQRQRRTYIREVTVNVCTLRDIRLVRSLAIWSRLLKGLEEPTDDPGAAVLKAHERLARCRRPDVRNASARRTALKKAVRR
jgi:hypothetical protein